MGLVLVIAFLIVPIVEIYVIIQVGQVIGPLPTVALLVIESLIGAWLVKREGRAVWDALRRGAAAGQLPGRELADAGLVLVGGTLLLTPGFVTDVFGFFFVLPPPRPLARRLLTWLLARRITRVVGQVPGGPAGRTWGGRPVGPPRTGRVVPGETVDEAGDRSHGLPGDDQDPDSKGPGRATGG
jgi:UPF0716 protein FxsA